MDDLIVRGGTIVDGSGRMPFPADIVISGARIAEIGNVGPSEAAELDATGLFGSSLRLSLIHISEPTRPY